MQLNFSYYFFQEALDSATCKKIIDIGTKKIDEEKKSGIDTHAYTFGDDQKSAKPFAHPQGEKTKQQLSEEGIQDAYVRDSEVTWLDDKWLYEIFHPLIAEANAKAGWNWQWDYSESFQFTVYHGDESNGGFYSWHKDGASDHFGAYKRYIHGITSPNIKDNGKLPDGYVHNHNLVGKIRKISLTCNLNEPGDYDGGNLKFDFGHHADTRFYECEEIRPQGSVIVFPSFLDHCVTPVTRGTRYSLVLWTCGDPFR